MCCIVLTLVIIFVMQTISRKSENKQKQTETKTNQTLKIKNMLHSTNNLRQTLINKSKKITFILGLLFTLGIGSSFAAPADEINTLVKTSFQRDFKKAVLIGSEVTVNYIRLAFKLDDVVMFAYYLDNGELLAVTRNIRSSQLPLQLMIDLKKSYGTYWISELFEINGKDQNYYYVTLENADSKTILRSSDSNSWELYSKSNKN
jgi:hypothetical protein